MIRMCDAAIRRDHAKKSSQAATGRRNNHGDTGRRNRERARAFSIGTVPEGAGPQGRLPDREPECRQGRRVARLSGGEFAAGLRRARFQDQADRVADRSRTLSDRRLPGRCRAADRADLRPRRRRRRYGRRVARRAQSLADHGQGRSRLRPRHRRQQGPAFDQHGRPSRGEAGARRQARLQRQVHHRDRRGDRLARPARSLRGASRGVEGRSVHCLRRATAVGGTSHHLPRLPRRQPHPSRCQSARGRQSFRKLGRRAGQSCDDPGERDRKPGRRQGPHEARHPQTAADLKPRSPTSRSSRRRTNLNWRRIGARRA
jgi:hypothetical protein